MTTAERLNLAIEENGLKQKFIAKELGISEPTISAILKGRQRIDADMFFKIASILKMSPVDLYNYEPKAS